MNLPDNPTPEQLDAIALTVIRQTFESDAQDLRELTNSDGSWQAVYTAGGVDFAIEYDGTEFTKYPIGGGQDG
jgi:hypothetical protein